MEHWLLVILPVLNGPPQGGMNGPFANEAEVNAAALADPIAGNERFYHLIVDHNGIQHISVFHPHQP